jgi:hypothetical protein
MNSVTYSLWFKPVMQMLCLYLFHCSGWKLKLSIFSAFFWYN